MAKSDAKKLMGKMVAPGAGAFGAADSTVIDRREQRERERALGLIPFAVKLNAELVAQLQALAKAQGTDLNETVAGVLAKGLAA